jgi:hypothetical protein
MVISDRMNILDLTPSQLKQAATIKEQVQRLTRELHDIIGASTNSIGASPTNRIMSAAVKKKIAATQKARWASIRRSKSAVRSAQPATKPKKKTMSPARRAKLSAKLKAYWASKRTSKK